MGGVSSYLKVPDYYYHYPRLLALLNTKKTIELKDNKDNEDNREDTQKSCRRSGCYCPTGLVYWTDEEKAIHCICCGQVHETIRKTLPYDWEIARRKIYCSSKCSFKQEE